ncbi:hypothetical protein BFP72_01245 [Reichenbachiella sp. 5M10]|uniref:C39 family peptidase n=1 Tax=Reichenbachiella sp. 5M10 TaxID=1889772 RepID=UPI000C146D9B|nr:C39 family peptidase [Reichenbachiella sp. 5M10]PIB34148.1 hypothetical protein BFP72_01245 [Reichenbachiella sp. 5M10]
MYYADKEQSSNASLRSESGLSDREREVLKKVAEENARRRASEAPVETQIEQFLAEDVHTLENLVGSGAGATTVEPESQKAPRRTEADLQKEASKQAVERAGADKHYSKLKRDTLFKHGKAHPNLKQAFRDFEAEMWSAGYEVGTRGFVDALEAEFIGLKWGVIVRGEVFGEYTGSEASLKSDAESKQVKNKNTQITAGVGAGSAKNLKADVLIIQKALLNLGILSETAFVEESTSVNNTPTPSVEKEKIKKTIAAITRFQEEVLHWKSSDGNISGPNSATLKEMVAERMDCDLVQKKLAAYPALKAKREADQKKEEEKKVAAAEAKHKAEQEAERIKCIEQEAATVDNVRRFIEKYPDTIQLAKALKEYVLINPKFVMALLQESGRMDRDNVVYALMKRMTDAELASVEDDLLVQMQSALEAWLVSMSDYSKEIGRLKKFTSSEREEGKNDLDRLMSQERLEPEQIAEVRKLVAKLPKKGQAKYYIELQSKVNYKNQRNNESDATESDEKKHDWINSNSTAGDIMCNLTSVAMALEYLGVSNPEPEIQFEDYLEGKRIEDFPGLPRTKDLTWSKLASSLGVTSQTINVGSNKEDVLRSKLEGELKEGAGIVLSAFSYKSSKGHIVRLQGIEFEGLRVDDPYGKVSDHLGDRESGLSGYYKKGEGAYDNRNSKSTESGVGEDNLWKWEDLLKTEIKYAVVFKKQY